MNTRAAPDALITAPSQVTMARSRTGTVRPPQRRVESNAIAMRPPVRGWSVMPTVGV